MSTESMPSIQPEVELALREFVHAAIALLRGRPELARALDSDLGPYVVPAKWRRGSDGDFRPEPRRPRVLLFPDGEKVLADLPQYKHAVALLEADPVIGPQLNALVGTRYGSIRIEARNVLLRFVYESLVDNGEPTFLSDVFDAHWRPIANFFSTAFLKHKFVIPLPGLTLTQGQLRLSDNIVLGELDEEEVSRCCQVGILQSPFYGFPLLQRRYAIGIRGEFLLPKLIASGTNLAIEEPDTGAGQFGDRSPLHIHLVAEDVLCTLRLHKKCVLGEAGYIGWVDAPFLDSSTSSRPGAQLFRTHWVTHALTEAEGSEVIELWDRLRQGYTTHKFGYRRFNFASERILIDDRIVDLVIAAEALLLSAEQPGDRGELKFRFSLRGAKFIDSLRYTPRQVFAALRTAYDVRSELAHGGPMPTKTPLPGDPQASPEKFVDAIEELVRLGLRKALSMDDFGQSLRNPEVWTNLVLK